MFLNKRLHEQSSLLVSCASCYTCFVICAYMKENKSPFPSMEEEKQESFYVVNSLSTRGRCRLPLDFSKSFFLSTSRPAGGSKELLLQIESQIDSVQCTSQCVEVLQSDSFLMQCTFIGSRELFGIQPVAGVLKFTSQEFKNKAEILLGIPW